MGLLSFFQRKDKEGRAPAAKARPREAATAAPTASDLVQQARVRARRRLIGATVLVGVGIIGFPLLFETQPRPVPVNVPIEVPPRDGAPPLTMPAPRVGAGKVVQPVAEPPAEPVAPATAMITEKADEQGRELPTPAASAAVAAASTPKASAAPAKPAASKPAATAHAAAAPSAKSSAPAAAPAEAKRVAALLEGKPAETKAAEPKPAEAKSAETKPAEAAAGAARFIVQAGSFTEAGQVREARAKVEKLGFKTYTQSAEVDGTQRTRVRVGPFATREEATKVANKLKAAGVTAAILTL